MRNLIAVAFMEPVTEGLEFPRDDWPLHITLVKFDVVEPRQEADAAAPAGEAGEAPPARSGRGSRPG